MSAFHSFKQVSIDDVTCVKHANNSVKITTESDSNIKHAQAKTLKINT